MTEEEAFIWIGRSDSSCSKCNRPASPRETSHITGAYGKPGCGVQWARRRAVYQYSMEMDELFNWNDMSKPFFKRDWLRPMPPGD